MPGLSFGFAKHLHYKSRMRLIFVSMTVFVDPDGFKSCFFESKQLSTENVYICLHSDSNEVLKTDGIVKLPREPASTDGSNRSYPNPIFSKTSYSG